jgi:dihydrolipoamide dehydrogenase
MAKHYDIAVIGAGPGGYVAALKAGQMGASVAIVEKQYLGGTCLNWGCIPSKALLASAELLHHIQRAGELGVNVAGTVSFDWAKIQARKDKVVQTLRGGVKALLGARKAAIYTGRATLSGPGKIIVSKEGTPAEEITASKVILAVGSVPSRVPGWPTDPNIVCTSDEALHWPTLPKKLLIVGGGVIGCEFACMMRALGVEVTVVEMLPQLLPNVDAQIAAALTKIFTARGIGVHAGVKIENLATAGDGVKAMLAGGRTIDADRVLVATGRRPNTADIELERVGIALDRGFVRVNDKMETPLKDHYCIGDANGRCLLAHAASAHGIVAVENALGHPMSFDAPVPNCIYTFPEIATVGSSAEEARASGMPVAVGHFPLTHLGKALAVNDNEGFVRVVRHRQTNELLGVHMIGHNVTEVIAAAGAMMHRKASVEDVARTVFAHPTIAESLKESSEDALYMALHMAPRKVIRAVAGVGE